MSLCDIWRFTAESIAWSGEVSGLWRCWQRLRGEVKRLRSCQTGPRTYGFGRRFQIQFQKVGACWEESRWLVVGVIWGKLLLLWNRTGCVEGSPNICLEQMAAASEKVLLLQKGFWEGSSQSVSYSTQCCVNCRHPFQKKINRVVPVVFFGLICNWRESKP